MGMALWGRFAGWARTTLGERQRQHRQQPVQQRGHQLPGVLHGLREPLPPRRPKGQLPHVLQEQHPREQRTVAPAATAILAVAAAQRAGQRGPDAGSNKGGLGAPRVGPLVLVLLVRVLLLQRSSAGLPVKETASVRVPVSHRTSMRMRH